MMPKGTKRKRLRNRRNSTGEQVGGKEYRVEEGVTGNEKDRHENYRDHEHHFRRDYYEVFLDGLLFPCLRYIMRMPLDRHEKPARHPEDGYADDHFENHCSEREHRFNVLRACRRSFETVFADEGLDCFRRGVEAPARE